MTARLGVLATIKHIVAIWLMVKALKLIARKDDARALRIAIPLTLAALSAMEAVHSKSIAPMAGVFRDKLAEMRAKLARLEGTETTLA